ncbi:hypothetical protein EON70_00860 [bacterium]|nr:MAG: hypothetical protein EON70_00860 [bacterium]
MDKLCFWGTKAKLWIANRRYPKRHTKQSFVRLAKLRFAAFGLQTKGLHEVFGSTASNEQGFLLSCYFPKLVQQSLQSFESNNFVFGRNHCSYKTLFCK